MRRLFLLLLTASLLLSGTARAQFPQRDTREVDSLRRVLAQHPRDTNGTEALVVLMYNFLYNDTSQAGRYGRQAERLATALHDERRLARVRYNLGTLAAMADRPEESVRQHLLSAQHFLHLGKPLWAGHNYANAASRLVPLGRYTEAMQLSLRGLRYREAAHDTGAVADSYMHIGQIYLEQKNLPAARQAYEQSLRGWRQLGALPYVIACLNHLAIIHRDEGHYPAARACLAEGLGAARTQADSLGVADLLLTQAVLEQHQGRWAASLPLLRRVEAAFQAAPEGRIRGGGWADLYTILAESLLQTGQPAAAAAYLEKALPLARAAGDKEEEVDALTALAALAAQRHDYARAFRLQQELSQLRDTLRSTAVARQVAELQTRYETEKKEARNRLQAAQLRTQQQVIRRRNGQLLAGLLIAGLLAGLGYLLVNRRRLRREVEFGQERQLLERQRAAAVLEAEEAERRRIGADLHDGVGQLLSVVKLNVSGLGEELAPQLSPALRQRFDDALAVADEAVREVRGISHNLLPNALIKRGLARAVRELLDQIRTPQRLRIHLEILGLDDVPLNPVVESALYRVIQELVQNIIKHAQATEMNLQLLHDAGELTLLVEDNGVGFDPATLGPDAGIGLRNIESRIAYLGGTLHLDSRPGHGTTVTATIPGL